MSITTPTTKGISDNIIAQLEASLNQTIPLLPKSFLRVLAKAMAAVFVMLYKYAGFIALQQFVKTASILETTINGRTLSPLIEWGVQIGVGRPTAATRAELSITITVDDQVGTLPSGSQLLSDLNGVTYITIGAVLLNAATVTAVVRASSDQSGGGGSGTLGNLSAGDTLAFANPLSNVARVATVSAQTVTGANAEDTEVYRQRVLDRFQKRPQGGAYADYQQWAGESAGIKNVYPYTGSPGQVNVYSEATIASSGSADGIPTAAQLTAVLALINLDANGLANRRNINAFPNSLPITRAAFDVVVTGITEVDDLAAVQISITAALTEYLLAAEPFIVGLSVPPRNDRISRTRLSGVVEDIVTAAGGTFTSAAFYSAGLPSSIDLYILGEGEKAKVAAVGFV